MTRNLCRVVAFYGLRSQRATLSHLYEEVLEWFGEHEAHPNRLAVQGDGYSGKVGAFSRTDSLMRERSFRGIESISLFSLPADGTLPTRDWTMTAEVTLGRSCAVFAGRSSLVDESSMLDMAHRAIGHLRPDYGIAYDRESRLGPVEYAMGLSCGVDSFSGPKYEESVKISQWTEGMAQHVYRNGLLRGIYPHNFLTDAQLSRNVRGGTLASWIQEDGNRGSLVEFQGHVWLWSLDDSEIGNVREVLEREAIVFDS